GRPKGGAEHREGFRKRGERATGQGDRQRRRGSPDPARRSPVRVVTRRRKPPHSRSRSRWGRGGEVRRRCEGEAIREPGERRADERTDEVDVPVVVEARGDGGAEPARRVHGRAGDRTARQDVGRDNQTDAETADARREG